ncbi:MAG: acyltransferase [Bacteroidetes bacterium]|nr:acyltransferase [Bacteroidota bacterium]
MEWEKVFNNNISFEERALEVFRFQAVENKTYSNYLNLIGCNIQEVNSIKKIPFLPIELYKTQKIYCGEEPHEVVFSSSGTTGMVQSKHYVKNLKVYEKAFERGFEKFYGKAEECNIYALLPNYLEREGSSLIYMFEKLIEKSADGGFYLYEHEELAKRIKNRDKSRKTILIGVTFALLDIAEKGAIEKDETLCVMETGGMKGRGEELPREVIHEKLCSAFGVKSIHSEYGMCECLSQSYSLGEGLFETSDTMKILVRDIHDPFDISDKEGRGGINIIDLANVYSCSFIETQDMGKKFDNGTFTIDGRISNSDIRGCNLLVL